VNYFAHIARSFFRHPRFFAMRTIARFPAVRRMVVRSQRALRGRDFRRFQAENGARTSQFFHDVQVGEISNHLLRDGVAFGLQLPAATVAELREFAARNPCWAERNPAFGFPPGQSDAARERLGRAFLLAQYFNIGRHSPVVAALAEDPVLLDIASRYLGTRPVLVGANMWWSYPEKVSDAARNEAAQMFHYDLDDFRFLKFFFYLTDVDEAAGPHVVVRGSHENKRFGSLKESLKVRRYSDDEIVRRYGADSIVTITGNAGTGFAEDTLAIHKGLTPRNSPRLLLQLQYAFNDYGNQSDVIDDSRLAMIV
jgi:hypothetical protein